MAKKRVAWNRKCVCGFVYTFHGKPECDGVWAKCRRFRPAKVKRGR